MEEVPIIHLLAEPHQRMRMRLVGVSVDEIKRGGARVLFELYRVGDEHGEQPYLTIIQETPEFRASQAGRIPAPDTKAILREATVRLSEDLRAMLGFLSRVKEEQS